MELIPTPARPPSLLLLVLQLGLVDSCERAWQLTRPCGGPPACWEAPARRKGARWLEEVWLGWMSTVHRAGGTRGSTATPESSPAHPPATHQKSPSCAHTGIVTHWPCLSSCWPSRPLNCAPLFVRGEDDCVTEDVEVATAEWRGWRSRGCRQDERCEQLRNQCQCWLLTKYFVS